MIRAATAADIDCIVAMGAQFFQEAAWADVAEWDTPSITATLHHMVTSPDAIVLVTEHAGQIVGMIGGLLFPLYFNLTHKSGQELFWWVKPEHRGCYGAALLDACEIEAKARGAVSWAMIALDKVRPAAVGAIYRRRGYRAAEHSYIKRL